MKRPASATHPFLLGGWVVLGLLLAVPSAATAQSQDGSYSVTYEEVVNNCPQNGYRLDQGTVKITTKNKNKLTVEVAKIPNMTGSWGRSGKFKAEARGTGSSPGIDGKFSMAGRVDADGIQALFIVELYRGDKPLCTQSWSVTGKAK